MTYCVGIRVQQGLVFAADTRTSAAFDDVRIHSKMHVFEFPDRVLVLLSSGNLATTQTVLARLARDAENEASGLRSAKHLFEVAEHIGQTLVAAQQLVASNNSPNFVNVEATLVLGGQIRGEQPSLYLIYPLGNWISTSPETPYVQIGESKYGKPILDRIVRSATSLEDAARCAVVSLDSTARSNLSVGLPFDLAIVRTGELKVSQTLRLEADTPLYVEMRDTWSRKLEHAVGALPRFAWENDAAPARSGAIKSA